MKFQKYKLLLIISISLLFFQCNKNNKILDLSSITVEFDINRYDNVFFDIDTNNLLTSLQNSRKEDSTFFDFYTVQMMRFGKTTDTVSAVTKSIDIFLTNKNVIELKDSVNLAFNDMSDFKFELTQAFKYFKHYFPNKSLPKVYTVISEFGYKAVSLDSTYLVYGLDMYLGKNFKYYASFDFPNYIIKRFEKQYMAKDGMEVIYNEYFGKTGLENTEVLINEMIENGKKLYFLECMMPEKDKNILIGYTEKQLKWCKDSEIDIWAFYNEHDLFYSKNYMEHKKHVADGPQTSGMPKGAPGNVGSWVGWQIVNQYMENAKGKVTLKQLFETDATTIMAKSKYKPK